MKQMKKFVALLLAMAMILSLAACGTPAPAETTAPKQDNPPAETTAPVQGGTDAPDGHTTPEELGSGTVKWSEEKTADGWMKVTNEGGKTLGYSPESGVKLIQVDGFAFKDMDRDGLLDTYEDWRLDAQTRAYGLANQLSGKEIAPLLTHGGWMSFGYEIDGSDLEYVLAGGRGGVTRSAGNDGATTMSVAWSNALQALCEAQPWAMPATVSIDPANISGNIDQLSLGATFDTDIAFEIGKRFSEQYRSVGISMLLGPQIDLVSTPIFARASGTYGEDPALTRDLVDAFVSGMQSTFAEDGTDLGWGEDSMIAIVKHYAGAGAGEGGRNDHGADGKYDVFPNNNYEAHLVAYHDGAFNLSRSSTGAAAGLMTNYAANYSTDGSLGEIVAGAYSEFKMDTLEAAGWDGFIVTDWQVVQDGEKVWGMEEYTTVERHAIIFQLGINQIGGSSDIESCIEAFSLLEDEMGEEAALKQYRKLAAEFFLTQINCGLFDNAYVSTKEATELAWSAASMAEAQETQTKSIIMLKNDGSIAQAQEGVKKTVYVPYLFTPASEGNSSSEGTPASWAPSMDLDVVSQYFNVITDTPLDPSGKDAEGNPVYTENDIVRASADDLAKCDMALVTMSAPKTDSTKNEEGKYLPGSLQYEAYTATTARRESLSGDLTTETINDGYGTVTQTVKENRSYYGNSVGRDSNYADYQMLQYVSSVVPEDCSVVAIVVAGAPMVMSEVEPLADVIFYHFGQSSIFASGWFSDHSVMKVVSGQAEPYALLPFQMPKSMEAVEAQDEDTVRDVECYVDANGNTYDFAFGMNWSGVINDERVKTYKVDPISECESFDFQYAK